MHAHTGVHPSSYQDTSQVGLGPSPHNGFILALLRPCLQIYSVLKFWGPGLQHVNLGGHNTRSKPSPGRVCGTLSWSFWKTCLRDTEGPVPVQFSLFVCTYEWSGGHEPHPCPALSVVSIGFKQLGTTDGPALIPELVQAVAQVLLLLDPGQCLLTLKCCLS